MASKPVSLPPLSDSDSPSSSSKRSRIIGGAIGGALAACIIAFVIWFCWQRQKNGASIRFFSRQNEDNIEPFDPALLEQFRRNFTARPTHSKEPTKMTEMNTVVNESTLVSEHAASSSDSSVRRELEELRSQMEEFRVYRAEAFSNPPEYTSINSTV
jgi:hypothetical protein